jgi:flagellar biosynthesis/type III secretory pathway chaperone
LSPDRLGIAAMNKITNTKSVPYAEIYQILELHLAQTDKMHEILVQEYKALKSDNLEQFESVLLQKQNQVNELKLIEPQLIELAKAVNGELCKESIGRFIDQLPSGKEKSSLSQLWQRLQKALTDCNEQNLVNHRIMNASRTNLEQILNILRGNSPLPVSATYGATGAQANNPQARSIAIA